MDSRSACDRQGGSPSPVGAVDIDRWEAGFACEYGGGGRIDVVGDPSADSVPEGFIDWVVWWLGTKWSAP